MPASRKREDRSMLDGFEVEIFKLVREHATSEQWREWLRAPLEHAAAKGNVDVFMRMMDAGADGSAGWRGCRGRTLLGAAAFGKSEEIVLALLKAGAQDDANVKFGAQQESALHVAAACGAQHVSSALLLAGADPNLLGGDKQTPLHLAAAAGHDDVVSTLMPKEGVDPNARTELGGHTPLHLAAVKGHALCVSKLIVGGADKNARNSYAETPLYMAVLHNRLGAVEELLAAGANLEIRGGRFGRYTVLELSASRGHVDVVRALLRHGGSVKAPDDPGLTALHAAADVGPDGDNSDVIRVLLEAGADPEAKHFDHHRCRPLHLAVMRRSSVTIRALLEGGASANTRLPLGDTPLHAACFKSWVGAVELLLRFGADEKLRNDKGETAEDMLGRWEANYFVHGRIKQRQADDQRIRHMLAHAPADRSWRRRGWLVLARSCPAKVQLAIDDNSGGSGSGSRNDADGYCNMAGDQTRTDLKRLVGRVVGLDAEGVFRSVVGFLCGARE